MFAKAALGDRAVRRVQQRVWVDLAVAFGQRGDPLTEPGLLDLTSRVPAMLTCWQRTTTGQWVGWVQLRLIRDLGPVRDPQTVNLTAIINAAAISPRQ
jgi:hypothetical protein